MLDPVTGTIIYLVGFFLAIAVASIWCDDGWDVLAIAVFAMAWPLLIIIVPVGVLTLAAYGTGRLLKMFWAWQLDFFQEEADFEGRMSGRNDWMSGRNRRPGPPGPRPPPVQRRRG